MSERELEQSSAEEADKETTRTTNLAWPRDSSAVRDLRCVQRSWRFRPLARTQ